MTPAARAVHAEWTKLRTTPGAVWSVFAVVVLTVATGAYAVSALDVPSCPPATTGCVDLVRLNLSGVQLSQVAVVLVAVHAVASEYDSDMIGITLAACPRRATVLAAKAAVVCAAVMGAGLLGVLASLAVAGTIAPDLGHPPPSPADGATLRAAAGTVAYLGLVALLGLGVAAIVRHGAAAIAAVLAILYFPPIVALAVADEHWQRTVHKFAPMTAGLTIQATTGLDQLPIGPWAGLGVLAAYAAAATLAGGVRFCHPGRVDR